MRNAGFRILLLAGLMLFGVQAMQAVDEWAQLLAARQCLTGDHKDAEKARKLLLEIVNSGKAEASPETLVWANIYLGYIEDRAQNRQDAIGWYEKALAVNGATPATLSMAKFGLQRPLVWIRHLDSPEAQPPPKAPEPPQKGVSQPPPKQAYVTKQPPDGLSLAKDLSAKERRENFEALWGMIDAYYAHFKLKSIDWAAVGRRYQARVEALSGDADFYLLMFQLVNELKDTHSWLSNYSAPILGLGHVPDLPIDMFQGRPFVVAGAKAGWEVLSVDGMTPAQKMEAMRPYLPARSSERAFQREAGRSLLDGKESDPVTVELRSLAGETETLSLKRRRTGQMNLLPSRQNPGIYLTRQRFVHFGRYPSGLGYIQIESFNAHEEIDKEFDRALEALRDSAGLILDIRDNPGGFGHEKIVARFLRKRTLIGIGHTKNGPRHDDLEKQKYYIEPSGKWQYTRPVALLVNDVTGSASDLFASELRSAGQVVTLGTTTHGNVGAAVYGVLPCGLVVRISNGYVSDAKDRPIEVNGNVPDITVDPDIQDYLNGRDPVLERATEVILKNLAK